MKPEYQLLADALRLQPVQTYKDKLYRIQTITPGLIGQDPETGEWAPLVIYESYDQEHGTLPVGQIPLKFARPLTEFKRKFAAM